MRHIKLKDLIKVIAADAEGKKDMQRLTKAYKTAKSKAEDPRKKYIDRYGSTKWSPIKNQMIEHLGKKCWYTEAELVGADPTIDHYRPKCDYWWLAFDVENYRVASPYANSPKHNEEHGCAGGKGDNFPLLVPSIRATCKTKIRLEKPVILDPCKRGDCDLLTFEVDGRPRLNPAYATDLTAGKRVDESMLLLNLDHPDFNSKREQLYHDILDDVATYEALPAESPLRATIHSRLEKRLAAKSAFSTAARHYLRFRLDLKWVQNLLKNF